MSKYSSDLLGLLRGVGLVASASVKTQEQYLKHIWSHSSVRDAIEASVKQTSDCSKKTFNNPSQELQNVNNFVKESVERSSLVLEGLRQYVSSGKSTNPLGEVEISDNSRSKSFSSIKNIQNLDIASITLKELENLLAEHNKIREVNLRIDEDAKAKKLAVKKQEVIVETPKPEPTQEIIKDEKQVESVMNFITNFNRKEEEVIAVEQAPLPEVSKNYFISSNFEL